MKLVVFHVLIKMKTKTDSQDINNLKNCNIPAARKTCLQHQIEQIYKKSQACMSVGHTKINSARHSFARDQHLKIDYL